MGHRDLLGLPALEALPEVRGQGFVELLDRVLESGEPYVGREVRILLARTPDAPPEERFVDFVYQPLVEADGTCSGVVSHGYDVTEQARARREVERLLAESENARAEAEAANRVKAQFLTTMSHELRTPLNAIGGYAELLELGVRGTVTPEQREDLRRIRHRQRHLLGLINEVLNFAKLETGAVQFRSEAVPIAAALAAAEGLVAPQAHARQLALVVTSPTELVARADPEKLRQILVNLLANAVKFTAPRGRIEVVAERSERQALVHVCDTGIGIPGDQLETIFEPFVQVRSDYARPHEGTGLGLAISRDLARGMAATSRSRARWTRGARSRWRCRSPERTADASVDQQCSRVPCATTRWRGTHSGWRAGRAAWMRAPRTSTCSSTPRSTSTASGAATRVPGSRPSCRTGRPRSWTRASCPSRRRMMRSGSSARTSTRRDSATS